MLLSANESYARAAEAIQVLTGMAISQSTQQRLVHRQSFDLPQVVQTVEEMSVDGGKVGGSQQRLDAAEARLWQGDVDGAIAQFNVLAHERVTTSIDSLNKHRHRIVDYGYYQAEGISIGSGAIESTVKQIGQRIKLAGAQWEKDNVPQVLMQRTAYLNGRFSK